MRKEELGGKPEEHVVGIDAKASARALAALPTSELRLDPALHEAIKELAPKRRRSRKLYALALGLLALGLMLAAYPWRALLARLRPTTTTSAAGVPSSPPRDEGVASSSVATPSASVSAPAPSDSSIGGASAPVVKRPQGSTPDKQKHRHPAR